ncbi:alpha/beta-hydrolase [Diplogelasinospora grovesii]|uniref:Alpha/beta-hydrolase n=1 Tax=Diplogelasinospora grovesii TaxID=303347 RepID=A0AAN6S2V4_9PEZI|nr:alpha/beta-hydrolase [Diplogelasinospora grovesii]
MRSAPSLASRTAAISVLCFSLGYCLRAFLASRSGSPRGITKSPRHMLERLSDEEIAALPYPPDMLPGGRQVETPYGTIQAYEWGPESGEKVLLIPGIGTPVLALGELGKELVERGCRVMMFDLFGRGWSDSPEGAAFDSRLYVSQILLVLASSPLPWTGHESFHLLGYSLGGGLAVSFARYFPHLIRSLTLVAPAGLVRRNHVDWKGEVLYSRGLLPEWLRASLVKRRLQPQKAIADQGSRDAQVVSKEKEALKQYNSDASGGDSFDNAVLSSRRPEVTVAAVFSWQLAHHKGFIPAFMSSIRDAPIYEQKELWSILGRHLAAIRSEVKSSGSSRQKGKVLLVLGATDPVIVKDEVIHDATAVLGEEGMEVVVLDAGHEIVITRSSEIADQAVSFWRAQS